MQKFLRIILTSFISIGCCLTNIPVQPAVAAAGCDDVQFIFARGSGEDLGDTSYQSWQNAISAQLTASTLKYSFYELGSQAQGGAQYPAVAVSGSLGGYGTMFGAYMSAGLSFDFGKSVLLGRNELKSYLQQATSVCANTRFVLGGYSQGAMVISGALDELDASKIIYVATFGDPKIYLPEGAGNRPDACRGQNLSNYRAYVPDCHAYEGILGMYYPYQPSEYLNKLGTWCNGQDAMCSSGFSFNDHTAYSRLGLYQNAASVIRGKIQQVFPQKFSSSSNTQPEIIYAPHDVVIMLHAGGDMDGLILAQYKLAAQRLANQIYSLGGRVALYVYGDNSKWDLRQLCDFACTANEFYSQLSQITHRLSAIDYYNSALSGLHQAMSELNWQIGATKSAVLLTNSPYTTVDYNGMTVAKVAALSLSIDPVNIYTLTNPESLDAVQPLSEATSGKAYTIEDSTLAITEISGRPVATLTLESYDGVVGETFTFDARNNLNTAEIVRYDWDLDADGVFELQDGDATIQKTYAVPITGFIQVRVTDTMGRSSTMSAKLNVSDSETARATISDVQVTPLSDTEYFLEFVTDADKILVAINDAPIGQLVAIPWQQLTITDVKGETMVRLIPYSNQTGRGAAVTVTLGQNSENDTEPSDSAWSQIVSSITSNLDVISSATSSASLSTVATPGVVKRAQTNTFIPKAPNTGVRPH